MHMHRLISIFLLVFSGSTSAMDAEKPWRVIYEKGMCGLSHSITTKLNDTDDVWIMLGFSFLGSESDYRNNQIGIPIKSHILTVEARFRNRTDKSDSQYFVELSFNDSPIPLSYQDLLLTSTKHTGEEASRILNALVKKDSNQITVTPIGSPGKVIAIPKSDIGVKAAMYLACADNIP